MADRITEAQANRRIAETFGRATRTPDALDEQLSEASARAFGRPTKPDAVNEAVAEAFGRKPKSDPLTEAVTRVLRGKRDRTVDESEVEVALARAFGRTPDPEAAAAVERLDEVRAAEREQYPWRAAATAGMREQLIAAEAHLTTLVSKSRGQSKDSARQTVEKRLREAWASAHGTDHDRMTAVVEVAQKDFRHFTAVAEIVAPAGRAPVATEAGKTRTTVSETTRKGIRR